MNAIKARVSVIIPALNEEEPVAAVVAECLTTNLPSEVIVVDNGSTDRPAETARTAGARVVAEPLPVMVALAPLGSALCRPNARSLCFLMGTGAIAPN